MITTGKYIVDRPVIVIDGKSYKKGDDVSWWDRADEFAGKSIKLIKLTKRSPDLSEMDDDALREYAKQHGVNVTWNMKRETILERLGD